jgi:hypothetical protein
LLTSDWLGVLKALCCSSNHSSGFLDVLTQIDVRWSWGIRRRLRSPVYPVQRTVCGHSWTTHGDSILSQSLQYTHFFFWDDRSHPGDNAVVIPSITWLSYGCMIPGRRDSCVGLVSKVGGQDSEVVKASDSQAEKYWVRSSPQPQKALNLSDK